MIWRILGISEEIQKVMIADRSGSGVAAEIIKSSKQLGHLDKVGFAELFLTGSWYIWWERRRFVHEGTVQNPTRSALSIASLAIKYLRVTKKSAKVQSGWKKPPEDFVLLNVDASFNHTRSSGSTGAVLRDSAGSFVAAAVNCFEHVLDAPMAEAMALREGMALAQMIGCSKLVIHSDCQEVVQTMQQGGLSTMASAPIF